MDMQDANDWRTKTTKASNNKHEGLGITNLITDLCRTISVTDDGNHLPYRYVLIDAEAFGYT